MTALLADKVRVGVRATDQSRYLEERPGADSTTFWLGALLATNAAGAVVKASDAANLQLYGVCRERLVTGTSNTLKPKAELGHFEEFAVDANILVDDIGKNCFVLDDATVTNNATSVNKVKVGRIVSWRTGYALVHVGVFGSTDAP